MKLMHDNYYSQEASYSYFSVSQYKEFKDCPARAMARLRGEIPDETTTAMLRGSYVDAYFTGDIDKFRTDHPEIYLRDGKTLKADFRTCEKMIARIEQDNLFISYLDGKPQVILTGEIGEVPFKGMLDVFNPLAGRIVDLKTTANFRKIWSEESHSYVGFIEAYDYVTQGAVYRELARQNYGKDFDFFIAAVTAESEPDIEIFSIPSNLMDEALYDLKKHISEYALIKEGLIDPPRCERCDYCKSTRKLIAPIDYRAYEWS